MKKPSLPASWVIQEGLKELEEGKEGFTPLPLKSPVTIMETPSG